MKQKSILKQGLLKTAAWTMSHTAWLTMAFSPVALGQQAEAKSVEYYKQSIREIGLDKKMTVQQFWDKIKDDLPGHAYYEVEQLVKSNPNALMPSFEVKSSKASDGTVIPVISFNDNGKTITVQVYGEKDKYLKYNNTFITETESAQPAVMFQKLIDNDSKLNQRYKEELQKETQKNNGKFAKFSSMNKDIWKKMTMEQRASYFIQMRMMYIDAKRVLETNGNKTTSSLNYLDMILKAMMPDAEAQVPKQVQLKGGTVTLGAPCVIAGYIGGYVKKVNKKTGKQSTTCNDEVAIESYKQKAGLEYVVSANKLCQNTKGETAIACNPVIYGYPNGSPICVDKANANFQIATHFEGPCDTQSRLSTNPGVVDTSGKDYSKIVPREDQIAAIKKDQDAQGLELSKQFLAGVLESKDEALLKLFKDGTWSQDLENEIKRIGLQFDNEIEAAIQICEKNLSSAVDKNQKGACDQLHRRKLFYNEFLATLKKPVVVAPVIPVDPAPKCVDSGDCNPPEALSCDQYPPLKVGAELNDDCSCKNKEGSNGNIPKEDQPGLFAKLFNTQKNKDFKKTSTENRMHSCKFGPNWWVVGGAAVGVAGLVALLLYKKKTKTVTNTVIQNTVTNNPICKTPPKTYWTGRSCECAPCGVYYMADGTSTTIVPNPRTCACTPPPTEGGSGDPNDDDSGGIPNDSRTTK